MKQSLKQSQSLTMTPQLQQAIKLLTLTHLEMTDVISQEMVENPMLEEMGSEQSQAELDNDKPLQEFETKAEDFAGPEVVDKKTDDFDWDKYVDSYNNTSSTPSGSASNFNSDDDQPNYENMVSNDQSLQDHLEWQARMDGMSGDELMLAISIIHNIDDDGFLELDLEELLKDYPDKLKTAQFILSKIKKFDPVGCGSTSTKEALLLQAQNIHGGSELCEKIVENHLEDLYQKKYTLIAKENGTSLENVKTAELTIMNFHPRPGRLISPERTQYVVPDIYVREVSGKLVVKLNNEGVPRLKVSKLYQQLLKNKDDKNTKDYVQDKLRSALWLIKSIENRQKTIVKVSEAILAYQPEFFIKGAEYLKPMILKDIAREVEMHESTISRVTTNKFMHTPLGTFELKYFFSSGVGGKSGGTDIASESLKLKIKALISQEDPKKPLSDQKIADLLSEMGFEVARRTVAKYREALGVMSSSKRKKR